MREVKKARKPQKCNFLLLRCWYCLTKVPKSPYNCILMYLARSGSERKNNSNPFFFSPAMICCFVSRQIINVCTVRAQNQSPEQFCDVTYANPPTATATATATAT